jgi:hypothetical protein
MYDIVEQGKRPGQYTERESEVVKAVTTFELEVQKAGYATIREFHRSCWDRELRPA